MAENSCKSLTDELFTRLLCFIFCYFFLNRAHCDACWFNNKKRAEFKNLLPRPFKRPLDSRALNDPGKYNRTVARRRQARRFYRVIKFFFLRPHAENFSKASRPRHAAGLNSFNLFDFFFILLAFLYAKLIEKNGNCANSALVQTLRNDSHNN